MVPSQRSSNAVIPSFLSFIFSRAFFMLMGILLLLIPIPAHIVWLVERRHDQGIVSTKYFPGIFKAAWWTAATIGGQANENLKSPIGRIVSLFWMFVSVIFIAYFTATVTTSLTLQGLRGEITGPKDLPGKYVATMCAGVKDNPEPEYCQADPVQQCIDVEFDYPTTSVVHGTIGPIK